MHKGTLSLLALALGVTASSLRAQSNPREGSRQLNGSVVLGWMDTSAKEFFEERDNNAFSRLRLNYQSYFLHPDLMTYSVQGRASSGFQDVFSGMSEGSGIFIDTNIFRRRPWPVRFYYSRARRSSLTPGLSSSFTRFKSKNDDMAIGVQWHLAIPKMPALEFSFDKSSTSNTPETIVTQGFDTRSRSLTAGIRDHRLGWSLNGSASFQRLDTQFLLSAQPGNNVLLDTKSDITNLNFQAQRSLAKNWDVFLQANRTNSDLQYDHSAFEQSYDSLGAKLQYRTERLQAWSQARLTHSDLDSTKLGLTGGPALLAGTARIANRLFDTEVRYRVRHYLALFGRSEFTQIDSPFDRQLQRSGNSWSGISGAQFSYTRKSLVLGGSYSLYSTLTRLSADGHTNFLGQAFDISASTGDPSKMRVSGFFSVSHSNENTRNVFLVANDTTREQLILAKTVWRRWLVELRGGVSQVRFKRLDFHSDFLSQDYGVSLRSRTSFIGYTRMKGNGDFFQPVLGLTAAATPSVSGSAPLILGSANSSNTLTASWNLGHSLLLRGAWRNQEQTLASTLASKFEQREAVLEWNFRKIRFDAGYQVYRYNFGSPIFRNAIIFRVSRDFRIF